MGTPLSEHAPKAQRRSRQGIRDGMKHILVELKEEHVRKSFDLMLAPNGNLCRQCVVALAVNDALPEGWWSEVGVHDVRVFEDIPTPAGTRMVRSVDTYWGYYDLPKGLRSAAAKFDHITPMGLPIPDDASAHLDALVEKTRPLFRRHRLTRIA